MKKKILLTAMLLSSLSIHANAADRMVINAGESGSVISQTISGIVSTDHGNAVFNKGDLTISDSKFSNNQGVSNYTLGGAVFNGNNATITNTEFLNNKSSFGAAIYNQANLTVENSKFINNQIHHFNDAWDSGAAIDNNDGCAVVLKVINSYFEGNKNASKDGGGAIYFGSTSTEKSIITGSTFINNDASYRNYTNSSTDTGKGGAVGIYNGNLLVENSDFTSNKADEGGAIYVRDGVGANLTISGGTFDSNVANRNGGAVYNDGNATIDGVTLTNNTATGNGGAIYNAADMVINNITASNNSATTANSSLGGAVYANGGTTKITNSVFDGNSATYAGGAVFSTNGTMTIDNSKFNNNTSENGYGGAIYTGTTANTITITNSSFDNNSASDSGAISICDVGVIKNTTFTNNYTTSNTKDGGGAVFLGAVSNTTMENVTFEGNRSASNGGAIATRSTAGNNSGATLDINGATFKNNTANGDGGAVYNAFYNNANGDGVVSITNAIFEGNTSTTGNGGAIYNAANDAVGNTSAIEIADTSFANNSAAQSGGAIYASDDVSIIAQNGNVTFQNNSAATGGAVYAKGDITIEAIGGNVKFQNNSATDGGDIYVATAGSNVNIEAASGNTVAVSSGVSGAGTYNMDVTGGGTLELASYLKNANLTVTDSTLSLAEGAQINSNNNAININGGTLDTTNNAMDSFDPGLITINGDVSVIADVNMSTGEGDNLGTIAQAANSTISVAGVNAIGNTTANNISVNLKEALGLQNATDVTIDTSNFVANEILSPIRYLKGTVSEDGILTYGPRGGAYSDFNPAIMASSVAAQVGGFLNQLNSYDQAFQNIDSKMLMTSEERRVLRMRNSYATTSTSTPMVFSPTYLPEKHSAGWVRPYASFENVKLDGGPKVSNVMYGTFFGADSEMYELKNGAEAQFSLYAGYNGSHQSYSGNSLWQNGGNLGLTGIVYKNNFFSALTANVGASVVDASTRYGSEDFPMLMSGVASKTGYNWELAKGKFIVQPNYLMSYTFVNTFDYTNAAGVKIESDPLHAIQIAPGIKFIGNLKNGWQPYINLRMVWNIMDDTKFTAAQTALPQLSVKPYFEYGVGVQKRWGERFTGFGQAMLRNGGRNGIALGFGFRWAIGKAPSKADKPSSAQLSMKPTEINLSKAK